MDAARQPVVPNAGTEYWGTLSIYDHESPRFSQSLLLFDKVVIPVPTQPIGRLTDAALERLRRQARDLENAGLAKHVPWSKPEFDRWKSVLPQEASGAAIAAIFAGDLQQLTRVQIVREYVKGLETPGRPVVAVPVYDSPRAYEVAESVMKQDAMPEPADRATPFASALTMQVMHELPVPKRGVPLDEIVRVRGEPRFRAAFDAYRAWQTRTLREAIESGDAQRIRDAVKEFGEWRQEYRAALADAHIDRAKTVVRTVAWVFALGGAVGGLAWAALQGTVSVGLAGAGGGTLLKAFFDIPEMAKVWAARRPAWAAMKNQACEPAGIVYEIGRATRAGSAGVHMRVRE